MRLQERLMKLAKNLWWSWSEDGQLLWDAAFEAGWRLDPNPVKHLKCMGSGHTDGSVSDALAISARRAEVSYEAYCNGSTGQVRLSGLVAYFSAEYGLHASLPTYSGGLGVLAGDHLKAASDAGIQTVAIGILYRNGYVRQEIDEHGQQHALYEEYDFEHLPLTQVMNDQGDRVIIYVPIGDSQVLVGKTVLYLLDTDHPENSAQLRAVTARLYGGDAETRIQQELVLGVGGVRMLSALNISPEVFHLNEGHSSFACLERIRAFMMRGGAPFSEALASVRRNSVFTTHTPVEAGHDRFDETLALQYLSWMADDLHIDHNRLMALGRWPDSPREGPFNMTLCALHTCAHINGVAHLHAEVSRRMFHRFWPVATPSEVPIVPITNGVHVPTWQAPPISRLLEAKTPPASETLWRVRNHLRKRLVSYVQHRHEARQERLGMALPNALVDDALTIGFARRFATYKRAGLIFSDMDRLVGLLDNAPGPVQIVFAGKAHPADIGGQEILKSIHAAAMDHRLKGRVVLLEDYDMELGRHLTQGADVWLNTPRRPKEASGTSGMKASMNGGLNVSILDGWWPEGYSGNNGWVIGDSTESHDYLTQDHHDACALYDILEHEVIPCFFDREEQGPPNTWLNMSWDAIETVTPEFSSLRQVIDYVRQLYQPAIDG
jgi:starch phosphorylase